VPRDRLRYLITQREARKLGRGFDPYQLYKHISGVNAVRLRRLLGSLTGEDYPAEPKAHSPSCAPRRCRTMSSCPVDLDKDIGGYGPVKDRLKADPRDPVGKTSTIRGDRSHESLIPRGGVPPGTGKTLFAAMATSLSAAVQIVSDGAKSKWSASRRRTCAVFMKARQSAPW
jgi:cell division protease FtsH